MRWLNGRGSKYQRSKYQCSKYQWIKIPTDPIKIPTDPIKIPTDPIKIPTSTIKIPITPFQIPTEKVHNTNPQIHHFKIPTALSKYQQTLWSCSKYQYLKFTISKYQQPYQNTNRPYDHVQNTNRPYDHVQNTNRPYEGGGGGGGKTLSKWNVGVFQWIGLCIKVIFMHNSCWFNHFKKDVLWDTLVMPCHRKINHCNNYYRPKANVKSYSIWSNYLGKAQHSMAMEQNLG